MVFMAAGPIYVQRLTGDTRFAPLSDRLFGLTDPDIPAWRLPDLLWNAYAKGEPFLGSGISAFPSMHVALSTLIFLLARGTNRWLGWMGLAYLAFTLIGSVHLGWHYALDGYASILLVVGFWRFWGWV